MISPLKSENFNQPFLFGILNSNLIVLLIVTVSIKENNLVYIQVLYYHKKWYLSNFRR